MMVVALGAYSVGAQEKIHLSVPESLEGDWFVPSKPSPYSSFTMQLPPLSATTLRIGANTYLQRIHKDASTIGAYEESGEAMRVVKDADGKEYLEGKPFSCMIRTNTLPWQIDLSRKSKDGSVIQKQGICSLKENTLILSIAGIGKPRPTSFDDPGIGGAYSVIEATRVKKP